MMVQPLLRAPGAHGSRAVGDGNFIELDGLSADLVHVAGSVVYGAPRHIFITCTSFGIFKSKTDSTIFAFILMFVNLITM